MAKIIDDETMENVCILAKLSLSEEEKEKGILESPARKRQEAKPKKGAVLKPGNYTSVHRRRRNQKMRAGDIVGTICSIDGVEASDIGIVDIRDSLSYVEVLNFKGNQVIECLQTKPIKGKVRKVRKQSGRGIRGIRVPHIPLPAAYGNGWGYSLCAAGRFPHSNWGSGSRRTGRSL